MLSPVSGQPLRCEDYEGQEVYVCDQTGGELITADALTRIVSAREQSFSPELMREIDNHAPTFGVPSGERGRQLSCPVCGTSMDVINYAADTGVMIDRCPDCGAVWLDHGELERIQAILERFEDLASEQVSMLRSDVAQARRDMNDRLAEPPRVSRFAFVNRLINTLMFGETLRDELDEFGGSYEELNRAA